MGLANAARLDLPPRRGPSIGTVKDDGTRLLTIGEFAARTRLAPTALRYYDDAGLLRPAAVDAGSGYRRYAPAQVPRRS